MKQYEVVISVPVSVTTEAGSTKRAAEVARQVATDHLRAIGTPDGAGVLLSTKVKGDE